MTTDLTDPTKVCSKCGERKLLTEFYRKSADPSGYRSDCKACNAAASASCRAANYEHTRILRAAAQRRREKAAEEAEMRDAAVLVECPPDPVLGEPLYRPGATSFSRTDFADTMGAGYLPDGSLWCWRSMHDKEPRRWEVRGRMLYEAGGIRRVAFNATFDGD